MVSDVLFVSGGVCVVSVFVGRKLACTMPFVGVWIFSGIARLCVGGWSGCCGSRVRLSRLLVVGGVSGLVSSREG